MGETSQLEETNVMPMLVPFYNLTKRCEEVMAEKTLYVEAANEGSDIYIELHLFQSILRVSSDGANFSIFTDTFYTRPYPVTYFTNHRSCPVA